MSGVHKGVFRLSFEGGFPFFGVSFTRGFTVVVIRGSEVRKRSHDPRYVESVAFSFLSECNLLGYLSHIFLLCWCREG